MAAIPLPSGRMSRRLLLGGAAGGAASALVGCTAPTPRSQQGGTVAVEKLLPTYKGPDDLPEPDYPTDATGFIMPVYTAYPKKLATSVPKAPGQGGTYTVTTLTYGQPEDNDGPAKTLLNSKLGATMRWEAIPGSDYSEKVTALLAGGDNVPQLLTVPSWDLPARLAEAVDHYFKDLGPFLSGSAVLDYPNLAALPTDAWRSCVWNGKLAAIPESNDTLGWVTYVRPDLLARANVDMPTNKTEFTAVCKALTNAGKGQYALGPTFGVFNRMYGVALDWDVIDGTPRSPYELPAYADALAYEASLWKAGYVHPDVIAGTADGTSLLVSGHAAIYDDGDEGYRTFNTAGAVDGAPTDLRVTGLVPFAADGGATKVQRGGGAAFQLFCNKSLSDDQVREVLGIIDYMAAPIGTVEYAVVNYGVEGKDYTTQDGVPTLTNFGRKDVGSNAQFTADASSTVWAAYGNDSFARDVIAYQKKLLPMVYRNPLAALWLQPPNALKKAEQKMIDLATDIKHGRKSMSDWSDALTGFKKAADAGRSFYSEALAANPPA